MERKIDLSTWKPGMGATGIVLWLEFAQDKGCRGQMTVTLHQLPVFVQSRLNLDGSRAHADLAVLYDVVNDPNIEECNTVIYLKYLLQCKFPSVFGSDLNPTMEFCQRYSSEVRILENFNEDTAKDVGYHAYSCPEPIILEPEDWTPEEWRVLRKLCGLEDKAVERAVLHLSKLEVYIEEESK